MNDLKDKHLDYYCISNRDRNIGEYRTLKECKNAIKNNFNTNDMVKHFNEFEKPMIIKLVWNNITNEYLGETYTPFIYHEDNIKFFKTNNNYESAIEKVEDYLDGVI